MVNANICDLVLIRISRNGLRPHDRKGDQPGKRHELKVELTKEAKEKHKRVRLRFRPEYIPVREEPDWAH
jgi:hypothetical protein